MVSSTEARAERLRRRRAATQGELGRGACPSRSEPSGGSRLLRELHSDAASTHRGCWPARRGSCKSWPAAETTSTSWTSGERIVHTYRCSLLGLIRLGLGFLCSYVPDAESNFMPSSAAATSASARSLATVTSDDIPFAVWKWGIIFWSLHDFPGGVYVDDGCAHNVYRVARLEINDMVAAGTWRFGIPLTGYVY